MRADALSAGPSKAPEGRPTATGGPERQQGLSDRLFNRRAFELLVRNTVASCAAFAIGLLALWLLVAKAGVNTLLAGAVSFIVANSLHYVIGRTWIYRGTDRAAASGYAFFLVNGVIGLVVTMVIFAVLLWFGMPYLIARIVTSVIAGLLMFALNATLNFRVL